MKSKSKRFALVERLFNAKYEDLVYRAMRYVGDAHAAQDIVQGAFVKFWQTYDTPMEEDAALPLIYTIIKNQALNHLRHLQVRQRHQDDILANPEMFAEHTDIEAETFDVLYRAIAVLPRRTGMVMDLVARGYSNEEIAHTLGVSINTVKTLKYSGLKRLRTLLPDALVFICLLQLFSTP